MQFSSLVMIILIFATLFMACATGNLQPEKGVTAEKKQLNSIELLQIEVEKTIAKKYYRYQKHEKIPVSLYCLRGSYLESDDRPRQLVYYCVQSLEKAPQFFLQDTDLINFPDCNVFFYLRDSTEEVLNVTAEVRDFLTNETLLKQDASISDKDLSMSDSLAFGEFKSTFDFTKVELENEAAFISKINQIKQQIEGMSHLKVQTFVSGDSPGKTRDSDTPTKVTLERTSYGTVIRYHYGNESYEMSFYPKNIVFTLVEKEYTVDWGKDNICDEDIQPGEYSCAIAFELGGLPPSNDNQKNIYRKRFNLVVGKSEIVQLKIYCKFDGKNANAEVKQIKQIRQIDAERDTSFFENYFPKSDVATDTPSSIE